MEKPLPDLPQPSQLRLKDIHVMNPTTLTIDAREHLHRFIVQAIQDEGEVLERSEADAEEWASALENALGALAERLSLAGWLPGLRRARMRRREQKERIRLEKANRSDTVVKKDESKIKTTETQEPEVKEVVGYLSIGRREGWMMPKPWQDTYRTLRDAALKAPSLTPKPAAKHVLLAVAPYGSHPPPSSEDADSLGLPVVMCTFVPGLFALPPDDTPEDEVREVVLCGLDSWEGEDETSVQIVGGTFFFHGVQSRDQYAALQKILRLALFTYLSNILEQCLFMDSHVPLRFPKPAISPVTQSSPQGASVSRALSTSNVRRNPKRDPADASGWWAYLSRKKNHFLQRATKGIGRRGSLDLPFTLSLPRDGSPSPRISSESSAGSPTRSPRFSFISDYRPSFMNAHSPRDREPEHPFAAALARIERYRNFLSTSPSIRYPSPALLLALAEQEKHDPEHRLNGDEKTALMSLLGWEGKRACGAGMADMAGFVRQQSFSVLYSEYVQQLEQPVSRPETPATANTSLSSLIAVSSNQTQSQSTQKVLCGKRWRWVTFRFFSHDNGLDDCLGDMISKLCSRAEEQCGQPSCRFKRGEHELRFIHGSVRISVTVDALPASNAEKTDKELPEMWERCVVCGKESSKQTMHDGTYLISFAKYLELLVYSPAMCTMSPPLCQHTALPSKIQLAEDMPLPQTRVNTIRKFSFQDHIVSFSLSPVTDVFEVRVPRLQILRTKLNEHQPDAPLYSEEQLSSMEADRRALRREIMKFWQGLSEHMDRLEDNFMAERSGSHYKRLPRLPSADDAYGTFDEGGLVTPKLQTPKIPDPPSAPHTPLASTNDSDFLGLPFPFKSFRSRSAENVSSRQLDSTSSTLSTGSNTTNSSDQDCLQLLTSMRHTFQRTEQDLYAELSRTPVSKLNDIRRSFQSAAKGATKRLSAWENKHAAGGSSPVAKLADTEPEWWQNGCHAVPGGNVIVRENDWGSIIAFTLSSIDYQKELSNMSMNRPASNPAVPPVPPPTPTPSRPSFFGRTATGKWFGSSAPLPDPDQEGAIWYEPETCSAVISRKEHPRDPTSLLKLGLPDVLRSKMASDTGTPGQSKFATIGPINGKGLALGAPPSAYAKPEVQISKEEADGLLSAATIDRADKMLLELENEGTKTVRAASSTDSYLGSSGFVETNIRRGKASSIMSAESDVTISASRDSVNPPTPPPKDGHSTTQTQSTRDSSSERKDGEGPVTPPVTGASGFATALSSALRYMLKTDETPPAVPKHYHGLLSATMSPAIDEKPHIKYEWTIGKRLKFSCTVYYAKQFDALRRRCGIENVYVHSLARCENWAAEGGKSRSNFWRTTDNQFIIKTLVNAWNVADLHVLIELGPSYFRYMDATTTKPTLLAKLLGFYTVEIKNLETGTTQAKADLLVMENLFYQQNIVKMFDLKGIQGRKVKPSSSGAGSKTLFDGEWIEGQQRTLTLVRPYSKFVLQEAIKLDCDFLMRSNIMDYSLLVGIDESKKQLACGLVDTIGSYTFAKTLEYKAKQGLNAGKQVTVMPPHEYQERFVNAMDNYFVACPDKWSRPLDDTKIPDDYRQLPSVL